MQPFTRYFVIVQVSDIRAFKALLLIVATLHCRQIWSSPATCNPLRWPAVMARSRGLPCCILDGVMLLARSTPFDSVRLRSCTLDSTLDSFPPHVSRYPLMLPFLSTLLLPQTLVADKRSMCCYFCNVLEFLGRSHRAVSFGTSTP